LRLLRPGLKRVGVLVNPLELQLTGLDDAAAILGLQLQQFEIRTASALSGAFEAIDHARVRHTRPSAGGDPVSWRRKTSIRRHLHSEALLVPGDAQVVLGINCGKAALASEARHLGAMRRDDR